MLKSFRLLIITISNLIDHYLYDIVNDLVIVTFIYHISIHIVDESISELAMNTLARLLSGNDNDTYSLLYRIERNGEYLE